MPRVKPSSGVYAIRNKLNGKLYIGSSCKIECRFSGHKSLLKSGTHSNDRLQSEFNRYGIEAFQFSILELVNDLSSIRDREQHWIDTYRNSDLESLYNVSLNALIPNKGLTRNEKQRKNMSLSKSGLPNKNKRIFTDESALFVIDEYLNTSKSILEIAQKFQVSRIVINGILSGKTFDHANLT